MTPNEYTLVEKPLLDTLGAMDPPYRFIPKAQHPTLRARENEVLFKPLVVEALQRINGIPEAAAEAVFNDLAGIADNARWLEVLRGHYSRKLPGEETHRTIRVIDFDHLENNDFAVTNQLRVVGETTRKPDVVVYVNGIPLVVIEAKSPINPSQNTFDAIDQIRSAEKEVPRLFHSNLFNVATNDLTFMYGATGAAREHWARWKEDPQPGVDSWVRRHPAGIQRDNLAKTLAFEEDRAAACRLEAGGPRGRLEAGEPGGRQDAGEPGGRLEAGGPDQRSHVPSGDPPKAERGPHQAAVGLYALLHPARLLDILAHFIVFETRDGQTTKKMCRYQQLRAVNKMVQRVLDGQHKAGLIWHTQGSGKSLTMVFAALKLKFHRGITSPRLQNPNLLVVTDRIDLHNQIAQTFAACGLPNPIEAKSAEDLRRLVAPGVVGRTVISTIFKFHWDDPRMKSPVMAQRQAALRDLAVEGSESWILLVDEAHRTQEKDLGAYVRAILPHAVRFGFTGTPVKKDDKDTFTNFGAPGETYLDKYGIDDAVADGATVPIYYQGRMTTWKLEAKEIDVLFDQEFVGESPERIEELKKRGVTRGDLARFSPRIGLIAYDIWTHFRAHVQPDGFKAQVVAIDRLACVAYKRALDAVIAKTLIKGGVEEAAARAQAAAMSVCIYSPGQHDAEQHPELVEFQIAPEDVTPKIVPRFLDEKDPLKFLIVCNKLLTGFDAPIEQAMYLDNPLTDHNLLQAIARTNRRYGAHKDHGVIIDYIGVTKKLNEALAAYRKEDVAAALLDHDLLADTLRATHKAVMGLIEGVARTNDVKANVSAVIAHLATEDAWFVFRGRADEFIKAYADLAPDPRVLPYLVDLKFISAVLPYGLMQFEQKEETDWKKYSEKIRAMLDEHLEVTGLKTVCKLHSLSEPEFWLEFNRPADIKTAAVRKASELKKETAERAARNPARYEKFSDRIHALIKAFGAGLLSAEELLKAELALAEDVAAEDNAHTGSGLGERAYGVHAILASFKPVGEAANDDGAEGELTALQRAAIAIDLLYGSDGSAPAHWQDKPELKKDLRGQVRRLVKDLGLNGWQQEVPQAVEQYAVIEYRKP